MTKPEFGHFFMKSTVRIVIDLLAMLVMKLTVALTGVLLFKIYRKLINVLFVKQELFPSEKWIKTILLVIFWGILIKLTFAIFIMPEIGYVTGSLGMVDFLNGNSQKAILFSLYAIIIAEFYEELIFRGYWYYNCDKYVGKNRRRTTSMVLLTNLIFRISHFLFRRFKCWTVCTNVQSSRNVYVI